MVKINDKEYKDFEFKVSWGNFEVYSYGKNRIGIAPFIQFNIENSILELGNFDKIV